MEMFKFENSLFLYGLLLNVIFYLLYRASIFRKKKAFKAFAGNEMMKHLNPGFSKTKLGLKFLFFAFAFSSLVLAMSNPQFGSKLEKAHRKGVDIMIAIDLSNSMLAEDIQPNRLQRAKQSISKLIERLEGDRIGIVVFGAKAYTQLPITTDYAAAKLFVSTISTDLIPSQGTAIGHAITQASGAFDKNSDKKLRNKAIVIITDGENHEDDAVEIAKECANENITVHTLGMGTEQGAPIPVYKNGIIASYKKDQNGNTVISKLNEQMLQQIASAGNGIFVRANSAETGLNAIFDEINKLDKQEFESKIYTDYESRFQYFVALGFFFLLVEIFIFERKNKLFSSYNIFGTKS